MRKTRFVQVLGVASAAILWAACGGDDPVEPPPDPQPVNQAPTATPTATAIEMPVGTEITVDLTTQFSDPDGDALNFSATSSDAAIASVALAGSIATVTGVAAGTANVTLTATDPGGLSASFSVAFTIHAVNRAPTATGSIDSQSLAPGETWTADLDTLFTDPDGDPLGYSAASSNEEAATASAEGSVVTVTAVAPGEATITLTATDPGELSASLEFTATVAVRNEAPEVTDSIPAQAALVGDTLTIDLSAHFSDPDGDELSYAASSSDSAVAVPATMQSSSELTIAAMAAGDAEITVTASDPAGLSVSLGFTVSAAVRNEAPVVTDSIPAQAALVGDTLTIDLSAHFGDPNGDELSYAASSSDSAVAVPATMLSSSELTIATLAAGDAEITVTASDPAGLAVSLGFTVSAAVRNEAPVVTDSIPAQAALVGDTLTIDLSAHFGDPNGDELSYAASSSDSAVAVAATMESSSELTIAAMAAGDAEITVTASDPAGLSAAQMVAVAVSPPPVPEVGDTIPNFDVIVDSMAPLDLAPYFTDPAGAGLEYSVESNDPMVATASASAGVLTVTGAGAVEDSVSSAYLTVTAMNSAGQAMQDSIMVRVHREEYDSLPGLSIDENGGISAQVGASSFELTICVQLNNFPVGGDIGTFTLHWSEWQRAVGGGWVTVQDNNKAHENRLASNPGGSLCPISIEEDRFPPGVYRLVGHAKLGDNDADFYKTPTFEKKPPEG